MGWRRTFAARVPAARLPAVIALVLGAAPFAGVAALAAAATVSVADSKGIRVAGFVAWAIWLLVHLFYLIGFQNRVIVMLRWTISFITHGRGARLISERAVTWRRWGAVPELEVHE